MKKAASATPLVALDEVHTYYGKSHILHGVSLNVAPGENDVWNHKFMLKVVSHTPIEIEAMAALRDSLGFIDVVRQTTPETEKLFSWWSYRAADFRASNRGLRLDHILLSPGLRGAALRQGAAAARVHDPVREWERPSDHAPVSADLVL